MNIKQEEQTSCDHLINETHRGPSAKFMGQFWLRSRGAANGPGVQTQEPSLIRRGIDTADPSQLILREPRCQVKNDPLAEGAAAPECMKSSLEALLRSGV